MNAIFYLHGKVKVSVTAAIGLFHADVINVGAGVGYAAGNFSQHTWLVSHG